MHGVLRVDAIAAEWIRGAISSASSGLGNFAHKLKSLEANFLSKQESSPSAAKQNEMAFCNAANASASDSHAEPARTGAKPNWRSQVILGREARKGNPEIQDEPYHLKLTDRWARVGADGETQGAEGSRSVERDEQRSLVTDRAGRSRKLGVTT